MIDLLHKLKRLVEIFLYKSTGNVPFRHSYGTCKEFYIKQVICDGDKVRAFKHRLQLADKFGVGFDERVVEYPWVLSKLSEYCDQSRFLDAGSTLNYEFILRHPLVKPHKWTILTLAPEPECFWNLGVSYVYDDLRATPFRESSFDAVFSISVIEHIGMDNSHYTLDPFSRESNRQDYVGAIKEMKRLLRPNGWLFLTVPFGKYANHGWLQQFDSAMLLNLISHFRPKECEKTFYRSTVQGWKMCAEEECKELIYRDSLISKSAPPGPASGVMPDVSATGLACIALQK